MAKYVLSAFADEAGESLKEQITALQENNIRHMEIRFVDGVNICDTPLEKVIEYKKQLDEAGISVVTVGSRIGKFTPKDNYIEHIALFLHTLAVAKILGATRIRMFSVNLPAEEDSYSYRPFVMDCMKEMLDIAEGTGITLYHENEKDIYGDVDDRVIELMDAFDDRMKFIFDPANFIQCDCDPLSIYPRLRDRIAYFHMKDALKENGSVVPVGVGDGNVAAILKDFAKDHDNTMLTIEPHLKTFSGLTDTVSMQSDKEVVYPDNRTAFDAAVSALKNILEKEGLSYE